MSAWSSSSAPWAARAISAGAVTMTRRWPWVKPALGARFAARAIRSSASRGTGSVEKRRTIRRFFSRSANSKGLARDAEAEVESLDRLGQLADRDVVDAGQRVGARIIEADLAGDLDLGAALHQRDRLADLSRREVLEQENVDFRGQRLVELLHVRHRELDSLALMSFAELADDVRHTLAQREVRLGDNQPIGQPLVEADAAAHLDRVLFQKAQPWGGAAGIEDSGLGSLYGVGKLGGLAGDPRQVLQEVQGSPFRPQDTDRRAGNAGHELAAGERHAIGGTRLEADVLVDQLEDALEDRQAGEDALLVGQQLAAGLDLAGEERLGGEIAVTDVLGERLLDQLVHRAHRKAHGHDPDGSRARLRGRRGVRDRGRARRHSRRAAGGPPRGAQARDCRPGGRDVRKTR